MVYLSICVMREHIGQDPSQGSKGTSSLYKRNGTVRGEVGMCVSFVMWRCGVMCLFV